MPFRFPFVRFLRVLLAALAVLLAGVSPATAQSRQGAMVLAASSLQEALTEAAAAFAETGHPKPVLAFAASSSLARQIDLGAPADLFISADQDWMDTLERHGQLRKGTRRNLVANLMVLVEPAGRATRLSPAYGFPLARALGPDGRLALADPRSVPAGKYARTALSNLGVWRTVAKRIAAAENVRAALALVERGQAPLGIVYATDALASTKVRVVANIPPETHPAIVYPMAVIARSTNPEAEAFLRFLKTRPAGLIFRRHGFGVL